MSEPRPQWQGERCLVLHWEPRIDATTTAAVYACTRRLREGGLPALVDLVPAYASLALYFDTALPLDHNAVERSVEAVLRAAADPVGAEDDFALHEIPVCYARELAPDLDDAASTLGIPVDELIRRHSTPTYRVAMLGFAPGFPYLLGLDPALELPRRTQPRARVAAGSVAIAGLQTGIYPQDGPGGWQLIGRTPTRLFDPQHTPPCPLAAGDRVRFRAIDVDQFHAMLEGRTSA